jgi:hypothetical protein
MDVNDDVVIVAIKPETYVVKQTRGHVSYAYRHAIVMTLCNSEIGVG